MQTSISPALGGMHLNPSPAEVKILVFTRSTLESLKIGRGSITRPHRYLRNRPLDVGEL